jgi:predicted DCC family thiol-disulfide oxidoreductase YuxK
MQTPKKLTLVYDDGCPTCTVGVTIAKKLDKNGSLILVGMNTEEGRELVHKHGLDMNSSAYALSENGSITAKAQMAKDVLANKGLGGFLLSLPFRLPSPIADRLYWLLAQHRRHTTKTN